MMWKVCCASRDHGPQQHVLCTAITIDIYQSTQDLIQVSQSLTSLSLSFYPVLSTCVRTTNLIYRHISFQYFFLIKFALNITLALILQLHLIFHFILPHLPLYLISSHYFFISSLQDITSLVMDVVVTVTVTIGSQVVWMTSSILQAIVSVLQRSSQL